MQDFEMHIFNFVITAMISSLIYENGSDVKLCLFFKFSPATKCSLVLETISHVAQKTQYFLLRDVNKS